MKVSFNDELFYLATRILNYAIEFKNNKHYALERMLDVLDVYIELILQIDLIDRKEFYEDIKDMIEQKELISDNDEKEKLLESILEMFINEWKK